MKTHWLARLICVCIVLNVLFLMMVLLSGCGVKTLPAPDQHALIPPLQQVKVAQIDQAIWVSWQSPSQDLLQRFGVIKEYRIAVAILPATCLSCEPIEHQSFSIDINDLELIKLENRLFYQLPEQFNPFNLWVQANYTTGVSDARNSKRYIGRVSIPSIDLKWRKLKPGSDEVLMMQLHSHPEFNRGKPIQFYWQATQEYLETTPENPGEFRRRYYRTNVYRRQRGAKWSLAPIHSTPLTTTWWATAISPHRQSEQMPAYEYAIRLVDRFENEGPLSSVVSELDIK